MVIIVAGSDTAVVQTHQPSVCLYVLASVVVAICSTQREGVPHNMKNQREFFMNKSVFGLQIIFADMRLLPLQPGLNLSAQYCHGDV